ncbi:hypothetical protein T02_9472 [Trichinella nativa]|uniref:Uncharacterized protein n=1 Tax=Trichinella nativa TaxID=6335 RepID=A0A0V1L9W5_9BILA|nr:hypothetical protein T02_9472 [Trichinella nativa]
MISVSVLCQFRPAVWKCVVVLLPLSISYSDFQAGINERSCWCLSSMGTGSTGRISKLSVPLLKSIDLGVRAIDKMVKGEEKEKDTHKKNDGILRWTLCRRLLANVCGLQLRRLGFDLFPFCSKCSSLSLFGIV